MTVKCLRWQGEFWQTNEGDLFATSLPFGRTFAVPRQPGFHPWELYSNRIGITLQMGWISSQFGGGRRYGAPIDDAIQRIQAELDRASSIPEIHVIEIDGWLYYVSNRCL